MTDGRNRWQRTLDKLGQKEAWGVLGGIAIGLVPTIAALVGHEAAAQLVFEQTERLAALVAAVLGPSFAANVARGKQRGEAIGKAVSSAVNETFAIAPPQQRPSQPVPAYAQQNPVPPVDDDRIGP